MKLTAVPVPLPPPRAIDGLLARQLGPRLAQLRKNPEEFVPLIDCVRFIDETGQHHFEACLFRQEDGPVYRAGTTDLVACFFAVRSDGVRRRGAGRGPRGGARRVSAAPGSAEE